MIPKLSEKIEKVQGKIKIGAYNFSESETRTDKPDALKKSNKKW